MAVTMRLKPVTQQVMVIVGASSGIVGGSGKILLALNTLSPSLVEKSAEARYTDRSMPATHKVAGAFGKEPPDPPADAADDGESES